MISRIPRGALFFLGLLISFVPATFIFAAVTVGAWIEDGLRAANVKPERGWPFLVLGSAVYAALGIVAPAYLGGILFGILGAILTPLLVLVLIARLGRW